MTNIGVGSVVMCSEVPDGALVLCSDGWHALRLRGRGVFVGQPGEPWLDAHPWGDAGKWLWSSLDPEPVTIVALSLTGQESADDLRQLAEAFRAPVPV